MSEKQKRTEYHKMLKSYPDVLSIEHMCEILGGISTKTGYKMLKTKDVNSIKVGRSYRITKSDLIDFFMSDNF